VLSNVLAAENLPSIDDRRKHVFATVSAATRKGSFRSRIIVLLGGVALTLALVLASLGSMAPPANADAPCRGGSHYHYHFPYAHSDYWHDHGLFRYGGRVYRSYHIHNHGGWRATLCA